MTTEFTPLAAALGGLLIGLASVLLMALHGRIAGMTGIVGGIVPPLAPDWPWRASFLAGSVLAPFLMLAGGIDIPFDVPVSTTALIVGGVIVGFGATVGSGCTSGHGVCGIARLSPRSIVATLIFMASTFATVYVVRHVLGGI
ncbi:YeeE/YedE family protein [Oricola thermophila]|uniref:YeeE/YedE family protein n=1 Tax=Oricola thermophila TaxID=2742145 RepID=A0A6N1V9F2_9HYPH|nr:YeeE/YedE thiosulfate transporter family protein [Oricola thermophila]QKV17594.1 YeeE/YedE family protein [Oricola thermophila]